MLTQLLRSVTVWAGGRLGGDPGAIMEGEIRGAYQWQPIEQAGLYQPRLFFCPD